ncbi:hypothetical protein ABVK25_010806 [Lepraria finkii]|uniref:Uncharacterized protein n=1 Tax=Lepraria finkii TaxID=1340010 RepID=A0ABR4AZM2_9LECA
MSSNPEVIRACTNIDIDFDLIDAARIECEALKLNTTAPFKRFPPGKICVKVIDSLKKQISREEGTGRIVLVLLPGATTQYLESPCIAVPIKKEGLPASMITKSGQSIVINWDEGQAWEIRQDVRPAAVDKTGGTLLLLHLK